MAGISLSVSHIQQDVVPANKEISVVEAARKAVNREVCGTQS